MPDGRHLPWHIFQENYLDPRVPALLSIPGDPVIHIMFQPQPGILALIAESSADGPVSIDRRNIFSDLYNLDGKTFPRVYVRDEPLFREFYAICTEVADRCQIGSEAFESALAETIEAFDLLLRSAIALSANEEIGLVGELLILESLIQISGYKKAVDAWRGADRDKHDFRLDGQELEVKTTTANKRQHWIHGLGQLNASNNCQLDLVSIQLARTAGSGALSLKGLVDSVLKSLRRSASATKKFGDSLQNVISDDRLALAEAQFHFRSDVVAFKVDDTFPRLSKESVRSAIGDGVTHLADVNYLLNVEDLNASMHSQLAAAILQDIRDRYA